MPSGRHTSSLAATAARYVTSRLVPARAARPDAADGAPAAEPDEGACANGPAEAAAAAEPDAPAAAGAFPIGSEGWRTSRVRVAPLPGGTASGAWLAALRPGWVAVAGWWTERARPDGSVATRARSWAMLIGRLTTRQSCSTGRAAWS